MDKPIWGDHRFNFSAETQGSNQRGALAVNRAGLDAARGLLIGLAISQVFWIALAVWLLR